MGAQIRGSTRDARNDDRTGRCIQPVNVEVLIRLHIAAACANVDVQRNWNLDELRVVREELAFAFTGEIPDKAEARSSIVVKVIELQVGVTTI